MKIITKKRLVVSLSLLLIAALTIWYLYPFLLGKLFLYQNASMKKYLTMMPTYVDTLPSPPTNWRQIDLGGVVLSLPLSDLKKIEGNETDISFTSKAGATILIYALTPDKELMEVIAKKKLRYPLVTYEQRIITLQSTPSNISFFNSRTENIRAAVNQTLKLMRIPAGGVSEVLVVSHGNLKAVCNLSKKGEKGYSASAEIYNKNETIDFSLLLMNYKDRALLNSDLLAILGGIRMPMQPVRSTVVPNDIRKILGKYNGSEQRAALDRE